MLNASCTNLPAALPSSGYPNDQVGAHFWPVVYQIGPDNLGPPISPVFNTGTIEYQYYQGGLLIYDENGAEGEKFRVAPLGIELGISGLPSLIPGEDGDGYVVDDLFLSLYQALGQEKIVGKPLTNSEPAEGMDGSRLIVQYFANLGFYWVEGTPTTEIHLIHYGTLKCLDEQIRNNSLPCSVTLQELVLEGTQPTWGDSSSDIPEPFASTLRRLGNLFPGGKVGILVLDGKEILVLDRAAFFIDPAAQVGRAFPYPLAAELNTLRDEPSPHSTNDPLNQLIFWPDDQERQLGYDIPEYFYYFIVQNGGFDLFGKPISQVHSIKAGYYRQCFANLCLDFLPDLPESQKLQLAPLGEEFYKLHADQIQVEIGDETPEYRLSLFHKEYLNENQDQEFYVQVMHPSAIVEGINLILYLMIPGQETKAFHFAPTTTTGIATMSLPFDQQLPMAHGVNGLIIPYKVCIENDDMPDSVCASDGYLIWTGK